MYEHMFSLHNLSMQALDFLEASRLFPQREVKTSVRWFLPCRSALAEISDGAVYS